MERGVMDAVPVDFANIKILFHFSDMARLNAVFA